jgi:predicted TIM-barrel fold metal-dependent hydrolase
MIDKYIVVDGHVHTFSSDDVSKKVLQSFNKVYDIEFNNPGTGSIDDVLKNMKKHHIDYTIMANFTPPKILDENNWWAISISKRHKNLVPLISFHPDMAGCLCSLLESYINSGARGIKIHPMAQGFPPAHKRLEDVYKYCNDVKFPIVFHCGRVSNARINEFSDLDMIMPVIEKYPDIPFVLTHMADGDADAVINISKNFENVYFDTSIVITGYPPILEANEPSWTNDKEVEDVINTIGANRVIFGSDYPWGGPGHDLDRILKMNLNEEQIKLIIGWNALNLFKI